MSVLQPGLPEPDAVLAHLGGVLCLHWESAQAPLLLRSAFSYLAQERVSDNVVLTGNYLAQEDLDRLHDQMAEPWQVVVVRHIQELRAAFPDQRAAGFRPWWGSADFSTADVPKPEDLRLLSDAIRRAQDALGLPDRDAPALRPLVMLHEQLAAHGSLEQPTLARGDSPIRSGRDIPAYTVSEFKGLEADGVVVLDHSARPLKQTELFVAVSRARSHLVMILRDETFRRHNIVDALGRARVLPPRP
jgi:hypothetical protein